MSSSLICVVTGASGYIGSHCIQQLLEKGYTVRGTVRSLANKDKVSHLQELFPSLKLYEADLLKKGSFDEVIKGSHYVLHTASPFHPPEKDAKKELVIPALEGTQNVLDSVEKASDTVKKVVLTSSVAAIASPQKALEGVVFSEKNWNLESPCENSMHGYRYSKRVAEEKAWEISKGKKWKLVVINPSFVLGPPLSKRTDSTSVRTMVKLLDGTFEKDGALPNCFGIVDVRDIAKAHVLAMENDNAEGRYMITTSIGWSHLKICNTLTSSGKFKGYKIPTKERKAPEAIPKYDTTKMKDGLKMDLIDPVNTITEMAQTLINFGLVKKE